MASEPFTIEIASFDGGLSQAPYTGQPDQYAYATGMDQYIEPGSLVGRVDLERFTYGPISSPASYYMPPYALHQDSTNLGYWGTFSSVNDRDLALVNFSSSDGSPSTVWKIYSTQEFGSTPEAWPSPLTDYYGYIFGVAGSESTVFQTNASTSNASVIVRTLTSYNPVDLVNHFGYLYIGWSAPGTGSSPSFIERYDATGGLFIDNSAARLNPAVELEIGWSVTSMEVYGDFIAMTAAQSSNSRYDSIYKSRNSRVYIWDGISNTFDAKVDITGAAITASKSAGGQLYMFSSSVGEINIYRYAGGQVTQKVGSIPVMSGVAKTSQDLCYPYVRNEALDVKGDFIYIGVTVPNFGRETKPRGYLYSFNIKTGAIDLVWKPSVSDDIRSTTAVLMGNEMSLVGFVTASSPSSAGRYIASGDEDNQTTADLTVTSSNFFAPAGKKMKLERALIRHSHVPTANAISVSINRNHELAPRTSGASYNTATTLISVTGLDANFPGVGDAGAYEHAYSFQTSDGSPLPLLDSFQLTLSATNSSGLDRIRTMLPIIIEGLLIDSPR